MKKTLLIAALLCSASVSAHTTKHVHNIKVEGVKVDAKVDAKVDIKQQKKVCMVEIANGGWINAATLSSITISGDVIVYYWGVSDSWRVKAPDNRAEVLRTLAEIDKKCN